MAFGWLRRDPDLEERVERLERAIRDLQVDWDQTYEKFRNLNMKFAKRAKREEEEPPAPKLSINDLILMERGDAIRRG